MPPDSDTLSAEQLVAAADRLSPEALADLVAPHVPGMLQGDLIQQAAAVYPPERQLVILENITAALAIAEANECTLGRTVGAELVNGVLKGELSATQAAQRLAALPVLQRIEAHSILSMVSRVNQALGRITDGDVTIDLELPTDQAGYYDRRCPARYCGRGFKIFHEDWIAKDFANVHCPLCGQRAGHQSFDTPTQREHVRYMARELVNREVEAALPGLIIDVRPLDYDMPCAVAVVVERVLGQRIACDKCQCRYSAIGATFYCPACGHSDPVRTFATALQTVRDTVSSLPTVLTMLAETTNDDVAENCTRKICENGLCDVVSAFEHHVGALFDSLPNRSQFNPRPSVFQNLADSSRLWQSAIHRRYEDMLTQAEWRAMIRWFQQRHKLIHNGGVVDQKYLDMTADPDYRLGQRLTVRAEAVLELAQITEKLAAALRAAVGL